MSAPVDDTTTTTPTDDFLLSLGANLLPVEVVQKRQVAKIRLAAIATVLVAVLVVLAGFGLARIRTAADQNGLDEVTNTSDGLRAQQGKYRELIAAQTSASQIKGQLATLMADDVSWTPVLRAIRTATPTGVGLTGMVISITDPAERLSGGATASGLPSTAGSPIGTLTLTGVGTTNPAIAAFVDSLAKVAGVSGVLLTGATEQETGIAFGVKADLSPALLSKLYAEKTN